VIRARRKSPRCAMLVRWGSLLFFVIFSGCYLVRPLLPQVDFVRSDGSRTTLPLTLPNSRGHSISSGCAAEMRGRVGRVNLAIGWTGAWDVRSRCVHSVPPRVISYIANIVPQQSGSKNHSGKHGRFRLRARPLQQARQLPQIFRRKVIQLPAVQFWRRVQLSRIRSPSP